MDTTRLKRLLLILGFILLVAAIILAVYYLFFKPLFRPGQQGNQNTNQIGGGILPNINGNRPAGNANIKETPTSLPQVSEVANGDATLAPDVSHEATGQATLAPDGRNVVYYNSLEGTFVRLDPSTGKTSPISSQKFHEVQNITWAPDSTKAVLEFPDDRKIVYDFSSQKQYTLPSQAQQFSFSEDSRNIAYSYVGATADENYLVTTEYTGSKATPVAKLGDKAGQVQVAWSPSNDVVGMFHKGSELNRQEVIFIGQNQENFKSLQTNGRGFRGKWTPDGAKLLYTVYSDATNWNPELYLTHAQGDAIGQGNADLGISTFVDKCTFNRAGTFAYCAVPDFLQRGSGMYPELASDAKDALLTVNLETGESHQIAQPVSSALDRFSIKSVFLSSDEATLFFTDASNNHVHSIRLR